MAKRGATEGEAEGVGLVEQDGEAAQTRRPCVGLPVQYHTAQGVIPAVLSRQTIVDPSRWDVTGFLPGAHSLRTYPAVPHSDEPRPNTWTFLPE